MGALALTGKPAIADGQQTQAPGPKTFAVMRERVDEIVALMPGLASPTVVPEASGIQVVPPSCVTSTAPLLPTA